MKVLVTGGAGFIGSMIADAYLASGHEVVVIDNMYSGRERNIPAGAQFIELDIRSEEVYSVFEEHKFDVINHHAAAADVRDAVINPFKYVDVNIKGTLRLLEACRNVSMPSAFLFASSGGCSYGDAQYIPTDEKHPLIPEDPYGTSKVCCEFYIRTYHHLYNIPYTIFRYPNVYGVRQNPFGEAGVIGIFAQAMLRNAPVKIFGDGTQKRDFVYVSDVVDANMSATENCLNTEFNLGFGDGVEVNTIFNELKRLTGYAHDANYMLPREGEIQISALGSAKIRDALGWSPNVSLSDGLARTVEFIKKNEI